jgi:hypothetical protein
MNRHVFLASVALFSLAVATPAFADDLNPQPEPPGVHKLLHKPWLQTTNSIGSASSGAGAGKLHVRKAGGTQSEDLNPQPLPPKSSMLRNGAAHGQDRMLNPQPLPPKSLGQNQTEQ